MIKSSDKNKIPTLYTDVNKTKNETSQITDKNELIKTTVKKYIVSWDSFLSSQNFGTDWEPMIMMTSVSGDWIGKQYTAWEINFGEIDEKFLPFIKIEVVTNNVLNVPPTVTKLFCIKQETNDTILKVGVYHGDINLRFVNPLQAKLFVIFDRIPIMQSEVTNSEVNFTYEYESDLYDEDNPPED